MLDERWSSDIEEMGDALRKMLTVESSIERVRQAEQTADGRDLKLEAELDNFGLAEIEPTPELAARIALELGRAIAPCHIVETLPMQTITGRAGVALAFDGPVPASAEHVAVLRGGDVYVEKLNGTSRLSAASDYLVQHQPTGAGERIGGPELADKLRRCAALTEAARLVGAAQSLLAYAVAYVKERQQFGKIIATYQGVAHRLSNVAGQIDAADLLVRKAAFTASEEAGGDGAPSQAFALMVRAKAVEAARFAATNCHQVLGGYGFAMEYDVQLYSRRIRNWSMRGNRTGDALVELGRMVLDPVQRDSIRLLWHYDQGISIPRWAQEADALGKGA